MKKIAALFILTAALAASSSASYIVVMRDGTQYKAKAKWTMTNGKALVTLETGQVLAIDPTLIDVAKSEATTKLGLGNAQMMDLNPNLPSATAPKSTQPSIGSQIHLRQPGRPAGSPPPPPVSAAPPPVAAGGPGMLSSEVVTKFERAYENVGIFEHKLQATGPHTLRVELTADNEDKVFNALSATSFLMVRMPTVVTGAQVDMVELFMKTTTLGSSGRFQMTAADAAALDQKKMTLQDYFIRKVIF
ncbi:MAG: hypothetical protein JWO56_1259 [Acidobacteria bacterium]|nr:hypothetical protein [Acidobacteriota bacterium]